MNVTNDLNQNTMLRIYLNFSLFKRNALNKRKKNLQVVFKEWISWNHKHKMQN